MSLKHDVAERLQIHIRDNPGVVMPTAPESVEVQSVDRLSFNVKIKASDGIHYLTVRVSEPW